MKFSKFYLALACFTFSCGPSSTVIVDPPIVNSITVNIPKPGTVFTSNCLEFDSITGSVSSNYSVSDSVMETGVSFRGKNTIVRIDHIGRFERDTILLAYESNGDISEIPPVYGDMYSWWEMRLPLGGRRYYVWFEPEWWQLPFGSRKTNVVLSNIDSMERSFQHVLDRYSASYAGSGTETVQGKTYSTIKTNLTYDGKRIFPSGDTAIMAHQEYRFEFSPDLGWFTQTETSINGSTKSRETLVEVKLKE